MHLREFIVQIIEAWLPELEEQHRRKLRLEALRKRRNWLKSDLAHLRAIGMPPVATPALERLEKCGGRGRPTVKKPKSLDDIVHDFLGGLRIWANPDATPNVRRAFYRQSRWFAELVEAGYRGELERLQKKLGRRSGPDAHLPFVPHYQQAEENVARVAGISAPKVRGLAAKVRKEDGEHGPSNPSMTAQELKDHLEKGLFVKHPELVEPLRAAFRT